jgi:hypothetical protein
MILELVPVAYLEDSNWRGGSSQQSTVKVQREDRRAGEAKNHSMGNTSGKMDFGLSQRFSGLYDV